MDHRFPPPALAALVITLVITGGAVAGPAECRVDITGDGTVNTSDLLVVIAEWGALESEADVNDDGRVDTLDLLAILTAWGDLPKSCLAGPLPGQIVVDPLHADALRYHEGSSAFLVGPGDPEDFLYRVDDDQSEIIDRLARTGANTIYFQAIRSHGGDGGPEDNPFINHDPEQGLDDAVLDSWAEWLTTINDLGIVTFFTFYDDGVRIWLGDDVSKQEEAVFRGLTDRFRHLENLVWVIMEEYDERLSIERTSALAAIVRDADGRGHPIAVSQRAGVEFDFPDDPSLDLFLIQLAGEASPQVLYDNMTDAQALAAGRYEVLMSEMNSHYRDAGTGDVIPLEQFRRNNWAIAMAGGHVMFFDWADRDAGEEPLAHLESCGILRTFFETIELGPLAPRSDLSLDAAAWVLAKDTGTEFIIYAAQPSTVLGISSLVEGQYHLRWFDPVTGTSTTQEDVPLEAGDPLPRPDSISGDEVVVHLQRTGA